MHTLSLQDVRGWVKYNDRWAPSAISIHCPFCPSGLATFTLAAHSLDQHRNTVSATGTCPACGKKVQVWALEPRAASDNNNRTCTELWIYPAPQNELKLMDGADSLPPKVGREYVSARNVFRCGEWNATALCCRRTLEAIVQNLLPEDQRKGSLSDQLNRLPDNFDLNKPVTSLADTLRKGGNLGAHFNEETEPDEATARQMIAFVEYLMRYLYVLPGEVESFHNDITGKSQGILPTTNE